MALLFAIPTCTPDQTGSDQQPELVTVDLVQSRGAVTTSKRSATPAPINTNKRSVLDAPSPAHDASASPEALGPNASLTDMRSTPPAGRSNDRLDPVAAAAAELLEQSQIIRWSQLGSLGPEDLTIQISTDVTNRRGEVRGAARFNLAAVHGYKDLPKCNLLAFEIAFRAGFVVPLVGRTVGWGFPSSEMLANDALDYEMRGRWAEVRRRPDAREANLDRENGHNLLAVSRAAVHGRPGHVAVIDWIEELVLNREGEIRMLSFMGWEANTRVGARYERIVFATTETYASSRFDRIFILDLREAEPGNEVAMIGRGPRNPTEVQNLEGTNNGDER